MIKIQTVKNNLKTIVFPTNKTDAVTVLILVGVGSRFENEKTRGISHFLEHLFFKGGEKFANSKAVAAAIDAVGGEFNAFTGKEYTGFYVKVARENLNLAFEVLADMLCRARFDSTEIEKERSVILQELKMYQDTPIYQIGWDFERLLFGENPMGWDQIGTEKNILNFSRADFLNFKNKFYDPRKTFVVAAGNVDENSVRAEIEKKFDLKNSAENLNSPEKISFEKSRKILIKKKSTEQIHLTIGFRGVKFGDEKEMAARLLAVILGGNMSSRMFEEIRDRRGLCYSVRTAGDFYSDCGAISTYAGISPERFDEAAAAIAAEYFKIADGGISDEELKKARGFLRGKLILQFEDSEEIASFVGTQAVLRGEILRPEKLFEKIAKVSADEINDLARELFSKEKIRLAAIGPVEKSEKEILEILRG
jgi:predicted Zn-dependent peptidase